MTADNTVIPFSHAKLVKQFNIFRESAKERGNYVPTFRQYKDWRKQEVFIQNVTNDKAFVIEAGTEITIKHAGWENACAMKTRQEIYIQAPRFKSVSMCSCCPDTLVILDWGDDLEINISYEDVQVEDADSYKKPTNTNRTLN